MKNKVLRNTLIPGIFAVVAIVLPAVLIHFEVIDAYTAQILTLSAINAIMALSVNIICGITGQLSLGQAGFMAIGCYSTILLTQDVGIPLVLSVILAGLITAFFGFLIGFPTLKLDGDYLAIVTLGFGEIIRVVFVNLKSITGGPNGKQFTTMLAFNPTLAYVAIVGTLVVLIVLIQNFIRSTYGRAIIAVRDDEIAANSSGIPVFKYKMIGFVIASFVAGIGGGLYVSLIGFVKPEQASFNNSINYLIYVVLGGMGSTTGSVLAAFVLTYLQEFLRFLKNFRLLIYPVILIIVMLFRPQGLLGHKEMSFVGFVDWCKNKENWKNLGKKIKGIFSKKSSKTNDGGNN